MEPAIVTVPLLCFDGHPGRSCLQGGSEQDMQHSSAQPQALSSRPDPLLGCVEHRLGPRMLVSITGQLGPGANSHGSPRSAQCLGSTRTRAGAFAFPEGPGTVIACGRTVETSMGAAEPRLILVLSSWACAILSPGRDTAGWWQVLAAMEQPLHRPPAHVLWFGEE